MSLKDTLFFFFYASGYIEHHDIYGFDISEHNDIYGFDVFLNIIFVGLIHF